jgi:hypothetical protein
MEGYIHENDNFSMVVKWDKDSTEKGLIKIIPKKEEIIISADDMLDVIRTQFHEKQLAQALSTTDTTFIPSVEVAVPIHFNANKDIKKGELVQFYAPMTFPLGIALVMEAHRLCIDKKEDILKIPREAYEEAQKTLMQNSEEFVETVFKKQIQDVKDKIAAETAKAAE